jgi:hypothetical protein
MRTLCPNCEQNRTASPPLITQITAGSEGRLRPPPHEVTAPASTFVQQPSITPVKGSYSLTVQPGYIYTLTTTTGQGHGTAASPAQGALSLPYSDSFDSDAIDQQPVTWPSSRAPSRSSRAAPAGPGAASSSRRRSSRSNGTATPAPTPSAAT